MTEREREKPMHHKPTAISNTATKPITQKPPPQPTTQPTTKITTTNQPTTNIDLKNPQQTKIIFTAAIDHDPQQSS